MERTRSRDLAAGLSGLALTAGVLGTGPASAASTEAAEYGRDAFGATNQERAEHDRRRLRHQDCVRKHAVRQARRMAERQEIWHQNLRRVLRDCHLSYVGENVASGYPNGRSVVRAGWMRSEGHRENILDPRFRRMEVAARQGDDGRWYAAQVFGRR